MAEIEQELEVSVVIPARNEALSIGAQLEALATQEWDGTWEIVVADNASTDATAAVVADLARREPRIRLVRAGERAGINYARNCGIRAGRGRSFALCDSDDLAAPGWLAAMGSALRDHPIVTGPLELRRLNPAWLAESRGLRDETEAPTFQGIFPTFHGNNVGMRKDVWDALGRFDEDPRIVGSDDVELALRAWLHDVPVHFAPEAVIHYRYRCDPGELWAQGRRYGRSRPLIVRELRALGLPRPAAAAGWRSWAWLATHLPRLATPEGRAAWVWVAGNRVGQLEGSIRYRTLFL